MTFFLKKLCSFGILLIAVLLAADYCLSKVVRHADEPNFEIWRDVMSGEASTDILISGDSRVNTDCYPPVIDSVTGLRSYSCGVIGHHFTIQKIRYDMYKRYNEKPDLLVQFVDNWLYDSISKYDYQQFLPWMWNLYFLLDFFEIDPSKTVGMSIPWYRYHGLSIRDMFHESRQSHRGYYNFDKHRIDCPVTRLSDSDLAFRIKPRKESLFRSFLSEVSADGIKLILVMAPMYGSSEMPEDLCENIRRYFRDISEEYGIPFLDYSNMPLSDDKTMFIDGFHLNRKGSRVFSDSLASDIVNLGLI